MTEEVCGSDLYKQYIENLTPRQYKQFKRELQERSEDVRGHKRSTVTILPDPNSPWGVA